MLGRTLIAVALAASPVVAAERSWPSPREGWRFDAQAPAGPGRVRFSSVTADPDGGGQRWRVRVECGEHEARTGRILSRVAGTGEAERGRMPAIGGTVSLSGGKRGSFLIDLGDGDSLDLDGTFTDPRCASGRGQLSTGD